MGDPEELELVYRAFRHEDKGCVAYPSPRKFQQVAELSELEGLDPFHIRDLARDFVRAGGQIDQRPDNEPAFVGDRYWYRLLVPIEGLKRPELFIKAKLIDYDDPEYPLVHLVSVHLQWS